MKLTASPQPESTLFVAIIDDAFAAPDRESVKSTLPAFCDAIDEIDACDTLTKTVGNDFLDSALVDDKAIATLFDQRDKFPDLKIHMDSLYQPFLDRRNDLDRIIGGIAGFKGVFLERFESVEQFKKSDIEFRVVFLDYHLKETNESAEIAKEVYEKHRAFIVLMSDQPDNTGDREAKFREQVGLLQGFFKYVPKETLVDADSVYGTMTFVPENPTVCHAIHDLIDGLDLALVGDGNKSTGSAVARFMSTIRNLPLQDYSLLCELTLADEGHPLGDYIRRLFGSHLVKQVFTTDAVARSLKDLDSLRFTEFLPLAGEPSDSLKELYASSLVEPITNPWGEHPWENAKVEEDVDADG